MNLDISVKQLCSLICIFSFTLVSSGFNSRLAHQARSENPVDFDQFDMMTDSSGWFLLNHQLFWTSDAGQTWNEIGPSIPANASVEDVQFIDSNIGWVLLTLPNPAGSTLFQLSQTNDGGTTWVTRALSLFESGEIGSYAEKAEMGWFDSQTGWISVKQTSSSNFSLGTLFRTSDGGSSWSRFPLSVSDRIYFSDPFTGWAAGGPANNQLFNTQDGGATWKNVRPTDIPLDLQTIIYPPVVSDGRGVFVTTSEGTENSLNVYTLQKFSEDWSLADQVKMDAQPGRIGLSILDAENFVAVIPGTKSIVHLMDGKLVQLQNEDGLSASIVELDMVSLDAGWGKSIDSRCVTDSLSDLETASVTCTSTARLLHTRDGGATWQPVELPISSANHNSLETSTITNARALSAASSGENTMVVIGQGFDRCQIPTISQMQTWSVHGPYESVNLYVGGINRTCSNQALTSSYLFQLYQQGWKFFPTWVGPQAPCSSFLNRMSSDVTAAYQQGVDQANLAVERLAELGLTGPLKTGSVIYYDMENYGTGTSCRAAVNAFINGWVAQIRARGNLAGVYGSTLCNTGLSDFQNIKNVPDVIWPARWYHNLGEGYYDPNASVWNLGNCLPNTVWSNHQRIRQYEGDHNETWGNLTLDIDSNVLDGIVAIPYDYPFVSSILATDPNPTDAAGINFTIHFSKFVTGVNPADFSLTTTGSISGASITNVTGSGNNYAVTANTGSGTGTIRLDVLDNDSIRDASNQPLGGSGIGNGNFFSGEAYTITLPSNVDVYIGEELINSQYVGPGASVITRYMMNGGPVHVESTNGTLIFTSQRAIFGSSFNSIVGYPGNQLTTDYWFTSYDDLGMTTFLVIGNPHPSQTAEVDVFIGGTLKGQYSIAPGQRVFPRYGINDGPVRVVSTNGVDIFTSERTKFKDSFNEVMGYAGNQLTTEYWFTSYDDQGMITYLVIGNPHPSNTAEVDVYIAGNLTGHYSVAPGERVFPRYGINSGPVRVVSTNGVNIFASERTKFGDTFNEVMGYPADQSDAEFWFTSYDDANMITYLVIGNPDPTKTADVDVYIGGVKKNVTPYQIAPGQRMFQRYGVNIGPVRVVSTNGVNIFASERSKYLNSFNEILGLAANQLTTDYWFTSYDDVGMLTYLVVASP